MNAIIIKAFVLIVSLLVCLSINVKKRSGSNSNEEDALLFLKDYNEEASARCNKANNARWNHTLKSTAENYKKLAAASKAYSEYTSDSWRKITSFNWTEFKDEELRRWFSLVSIFGDAALPEAEFVKYSNARGQMAANYDDATFCDFNNLDNCGMKFLPNVNNKLSNVESSYEERQFYWSQFMSKIGKKSYQAFVNYVDLANEASSLNGYENRAEQWKDEYEVSALESLSIDLWSKVRPLYLQIHAYVRKHLRKRYPKKILSDGPIPAHLLGSIWAQSWKPLMKILKPFPNKPSFDVTEEMKRQNYTIEGIVTLAERFFLSLGLEGVGEQFLNNSYLVPSKAANFNCISTSWQFCDTKDFRIMMCVDISMSHLVTMHHELGHIHYYKSYAHLPIRFREAANPAFHEALGDIISMSVQTPWYLGELGLLSPEEIKFSEDEESDINFLMSMALDKIAFLPSALIFDLWRWRVFDGRIEEDEMNSAWYELRQKYQGLCSPVERVESELDPLGKYHVAYAMTFINYFVGIFLTFQFHKELCRETGFKGPLHRCSIYNSTAAGDKLRLGDEQFVVRRIMEMGQSKPWPEAISILTNGRTSAMEAEPLLEYFEPLHKWLKVQNEGEKLGWDGDDYMICPKHRKKRADLKMNKNPFDPRICSAQTPTYCGFKLT